MNYLKCFKLGILILLAQSSFTLAGVITVEFQGAVSFVKSGLDTDFSLGEEVSGRYSYEALNQTDIFPDNDEIARFHALTDFQLNVGSHSWSSSHNGYIQVRDRPASSPSFPLEERYSVVQQIFEADNGSRNDLFLTSLATDAISGRNELNGIELPSFVPFDASDYSLLFLFGVQDGGFLQMNADIESISVPEPSVVQLFFLAIMGLVIFQYSEK